MLALQELVKPDEQKEKDKEKLERQKAFARMALGADGGSLVRRDRKYFIAHTRSRLLITMSRLLYYCTTMNRLFNVYDLDDLRE